MWMKVIFLIILSNSLITKSQDTNSLISCSYQYVDDDRYACVLALNNPEGTDNFDAIPGEHIGRRTNANVVAVTARDQNSQIIPLVICRQFPNLKELSILRSNVASINEWNFIGCRNLERLRLDTNNIEEIPEHTFRNNGQLEVVSLSTNRVHLLTPNAFAGTKIKHLNLRNNKLGDFDPQWFVHIADTLEVIDIASNGIFTLPSKGFLPFANLRYLDLAGNKLLNLLDDTFTGLNRLEFLGVSSCGLPELNPAHFIHLQSLDELRLEHNNIRILPPMIFGTLTRLRRLYLSYNNITSLGVNVFGPRNLYVIEIVALDNNPVISVQQSFVERARHLTTLDLYNTKCHNSTVHSIPQRSFYNIRHELMKCFSSFGVFPSAFCASSHEGNICELQIVNPLGINLPSILDIHRRNSSEIRRVIASESSTANIPTIICQQFTELTEIIIRSSFVQIINRNGLNCRKVSRLDLSFNEITTVDDHVFADMPLLTDISLTANKINQLQPNSFTGTSIRMLDLSSNMFDRFSSEWTQVIAGSLESLDLSRNQLIRIDGGSFGNLRNLRSLMLNSNFKMEIGGKTFSELPSLEHLQLSECLLTELNSEWFSTLTNLRHLSLGNNQLSEFKSRIFNTLTNLQELIFFNNRLVELRADSFGASLPNMQMLFGSSNSMVSFDPEILITGNRLSTISFYANICIRENFFDVQANLAAVRESLQPCTNNFGLRNVLQCSYSRVNANQVYRCELSIVNPLGSNNFGAVYGEHSTGSNNDTVSEVIAEGQNTGIIPSILCRQFRNLEVLNFTSNGINQLAEESFSSCGSLRELSVRMDLIRIIPSRGFVGAPNLKNLHLNHNQIVVIHQSAFVETKIQTLDLSFNEIFEFDPATFSTIGDSLQVLRLSHNHLESMPSNALDLLPLLVELELSHNNFFNLPYDIFEHSTKLEILKISNCNLKRIHPDLFCRLDKLKDLQLTSNEVDFLGKNVFDLPNLQSIELTGNKLRTLDSAVFGRSLLSLVSIEAADNEIMAFDPEILNDNVKLRTLNLANNNCTDENFSEISPGNDILNKLGACIDAYNDVLVTCEYMILEDFYSCILTINVENDRLRFEKAKGEHQAGSEDDSVLRIVAEEQHSRSIPSFICQQFKSLEDLFFMNSSVETISSQDFIDCPHLIIIDLSHNLIAEVPVGVFSKNPRLWMLNLSYNRITTLRSEVFDGTTIEHLDLGHNQLKCFNPEWLTPIASKLISLDLYVNHLHSLSPRIFSSFENLERIDIGSNGDIFIPSSAFENLSNLHVLNIRGTYQAILNPHWFNGLTKLEDILAGWNSITTIHDRIFDIPTLKFVEVTGNQITRLSSKSFGSSLSGIVVIHAHQNSINAVDRRIFEDGEELVEFSLAGNRCADADFHDVQGRRDEVMETLQQCFTNFDNTPF